jgi:hypothetical protein
MSSDCQMPGTVHDWEIPSRSFLKRVNSHILVWGGDVPRPTRSRSQACRSARSAYAGGVPNGLTFGLISRLQQRVPCIYERSCFLIKILKKLTNSQSRKFSSRQSNGPHNSIIIPTKRTVEHSPFTTQTVDKEREILIASIRRRNS